MAEIVRLRKQRGIIKSKLTRLITKVDREDPVHRIEAEVYLTRLKEIRQEFECIQQEITISFEGEPMVADNTEDAEFEERYFELKVKLKQWLINVPTHQAEARSISSDETLARVLEQQSELIRQVRQQNDGSRAPNDGGDAIARLFEQQTALLRGIAAAGGAANTPTGVKLPVVKLPTFDGCIEDWQRFSETLKSMIHSNVNIPDIQKFQYLVTSVHGSAAKIIESIELTDANYTVAWELMKKRFDDPRAIKKKHIQYLFAMPTVEKESAAAIRDLVDFTLKHLRVLKSLDSPTDSWDELIIHMVEARLDATTLRAWEQSGNTDAASLTTLTDFLESRCQMLERIEARAKERDVPWKIEPVKQKSKSFVQGKVSSSEKSTTLANSTDVGRCYLCRGEHYLYSCEKFLALPIEDRLKEVRRLKLCINCLRNDHFVKTCKMGSCRQCSGRHNTLCQRPTSEGNTISHENSNDQPVEEASGSSSNVVVHHAARYSKRRHVLMATAVVSAEHPNGTRVPLHILLDSVSEAHFITHTACNRLGVKRDRASEIVTGLSEIENVISQSCEVVIRSRYSDVHANARCFVVPKITKKLPSVEINRDAFKIPSNIKLADPEFHKRSSIDMLIGAELFFDWLETERMELGDDRPILQNTALGWIVAGSFAPTAVLLCNYEGITTLNCSVEQCETLNRNLTNFWEIESCQSDTTKTQSVESREIEEFFEKTTTRDSDHRFVVRLPFLEDPKVLGESRNIATRRLLQLERRFRNDNRLFERYREFLRDYVESGHMSLVNEPSRNSERPVVYLPHHGVIKQASTSTKLRVVFDASSKTGSRKSLNDILRVGPTLQGSMLEIVVRFRLYQVALTGDIRQCTDKWSYTLTIETVSESSGDFL